MVADLQAFLAVITIIAVVIAYWKAARQQSAPPSAKGKIPFIGAAIEYGADPVQFLKKSRAKLGNVFTVNLVLMKITFILGAEAQQAFFKAKNEDLELEGAVQPFIRNLMGDNMWGNKKWNAVYPPLLKKGFMSFDQLNRYFRVVQTTVSERFQFLTTQPKIDLFREISRTIMEINIKVFMGEELWKENGSELADLFYFAETNAFSPLIIALGTTFPSPLALKIKRSRRRMLDILIEEFSRIKKRVNEDPEHEPQTYAEVLMQGEGNNFEMETFGLHVFSIMFAAHTNTAGSLGWTLAHIAEDARILNNTRENFASVGPEAGDQWTHEKIASCKYLDACIKETIRLHSLLVAFRKVMNPFQLGDFVLAKDSIVCVSPYIVHHDPDIYSNPAVYDPERWTDVKKLQKHIANKTYVQFGFGEHACLGERFALMVMKTTLTELFSKYSVDLLTPLGKDDFSRAIGTPFAKNPMYIKLNPLADHN